MFDFEKYTEHFKPERFGITVTKVLEHRMFGLETFWNFLFFARKNQDSNSKCLLSGVDEKKKLQVGANVGDLDGAALG